MNEDIKDMTQARRLITQLRAVLQAQQSEHLSTHRKLAAETLRADQGWQRYEEANADRNQLRMNKTQQQCNYPICQSEAEQQRVAAQVHGELYSGITDDAKDAARYRWLRHGDNDELVIQHGPVEPDYHWLPRNERLDSMIDEAMAKESNAKP